MQRFARSLAFGFATLGILAGAANAGWKTDLDAALQQAKETGRPVLIHFYADWCGPCRQMESTVLNSSKVLDACRTACIAVKVNLDHHEAVAQKYGVAALPTDVFVSPTGEILGRHVGKASIDQYVARMTDAAAQVDPATTTAEMTSDVTDLLTQLASSFGVGLEGYSPVALTVDRVWTKGNPEFAWRHAGVMYHLADAQELEQFKADPEKYAPRYSGFDPLILSVEGEAVPGQIVFGSFFEDRLHLHATKESRESFLKNPSGYPAPDKLEVPAVVAKREPVVAEVPTASGI